MWIVTFCYCLSKPVISISDFCVLYNVQAGRPTLVNHWLTCRSLQGDLWNHENTNVVKYKIKPCDRRNGSFIMVIGSLDEGKSRRSHLLIHQRSRHLMSLLYMSGLHHHYRHGQQVASYGNIWYSFACCIWFICIKTTLDSSPLVE